MQGTTKSGFHFEVDENKANSFSLVEAVAEMQKTKSEIEQIGLAMDVIDILIGQEQKEKIKEHVTGIHGYDDVDAVMVEVFEILQKAREAKIVKNSSSSEA